MQHNADARPLCCSILKSGEAVLSVYLRACGQSSKHPPWRRLGRSSPCTQLFFCIMLSTAVFRVLDWTLTVPPIIHPVNFPARCPALTPPTWSQAVVPFILLQIHRRAERDVSQCSSTQRNTGVSSVRGQWRSLVMDGSCKFQQRKHFHANNSICLLATHAWDAQTSPGSCAHANIRATRRNKTGKTHKEDCDNTLMHAAEVMRWCMRALKPLSRACFTSLSTGLSA